MPAQLPAPIPDGDSAPYWEAVNRGELLIQQCDDCTQHIFYPRSICPHCFSDHISWVKATGKGRIYSYTVVHRAFGPFAAETPYVVGLVELDEGVRMMTRILGPREEVAIDKTVEVTFVQMGEDFKLPYFKLQ